MRLPRRWMPPNTDTSCCSSCAYLLVVGHRFWRSPSLPVALLGGPEVSQIRRLLTFAGRHQIAISAQVIVLVPDNDVVVSLGAVVLRPLHLGQAAVILGHCPRTRQGVVGCGHFVVKDVRVGLVEKEALLDDRLVVIGHRSAALV